VSFKTIFKPSAEKQLRGLPKPLQKRIIEKLAGVQSNPRSAGAVKLAGVAATWRVRVGDYRIVYEIQETDETVFITIIAHRREAYRYL
jgi:mRNA interferase RelE/StbE